MPTPQQPLTPRIVAGGESRDPRARARTLAKALTADTGGALGLLHSRLPHGEGAPLHVHTREDEAWIVVEGEIEYAVSAAPAGPDTPPTDLVRTVAGAGAFVFAPRGYAHTLFVRSDSALVWTLLLPGGLEEFLLDRGEGSDPDPGPYGVTIYDAPSPWATDG